MIHHLLEKYQDSIAEKILSYLDINSLEAAEAVSICWYSFIKEARLWKKLYDRSVVKCRALSLLYQRRIAEGIQEDEFLHKKLLSARKKVLTNWCTGNYSKKSINVGRCSRFVVNSKHVITIDSTLSVSIWNRYTLVGEQLPLQSDTTLSELTHLELVDDFVFCSYRDGAIVMWDIAAKSVIRAFRDEQMSGCDLKIHVAHGLIVSFVSVVSPHTGGYQTRFSVRRIDNPSEMIRQEITNRVPCARAQTVSSDQNYFVVFLLCSNDYIVSRDDFKIQLRSTSSFEIVREICGIMTSRDIFSYFDGWLAVGGKDNTEVRIWDIEKENCQFTIPVSNETQIADIQINDHCIIIRDSSGTFQVRHFNRFVHCNADFDITGEQVKRGYQKFKFDHLQIISAHTNTEDFENRHDVLMLLNF